MTNAQSKIKVCEENYPWPHLSLSQERALVKKCINNAEKKSRMNKKAQFNYSLWYDYDIDGFVVQFEYDGCFAKGRG